MPRPFMAAASSTVVVFAWLSILTPWAQAQPTPQGLVLWLDAARSDTLAVESDGSVIRWEDRSGCGNHAEQANTAARPVFVARAIGDHPALRFDGSDFLKVGTAGRLNFRPGSPFTMAAVYRKAAGQLGTLVSRGGGPANGRAFQLYVTPSRLGTVTYGVMREQDAGSGAHLAIQVCDGKRAEVFLDGRRGLGFETGASSVAEDVDVLIGARRENADNTGTFYSLTGEIAELLIYDRALGEQELRALGKYVSEKYALETEYRPLDTAKQIAAFLEKPDGFRQLDAVADRLVREGEQAVDTLRSIASQPSPRAALATAELLRLLAQKNKLTPALAELAVALLEHADPFVRGQAEWAVAMKVGTENNGQLAVWPASPSPAWFDAWAALTPEFLLEADWVRQAVAMEIHHSPAKLLQSVQAMLERAERMQSVWSFDVETGNGPRTASMAWKSLEDIFQQLALAIQSAPRDVAAHHRLWISARRCLRTIVLANPRLDFDQIVFAKQFTPHTVRNITRSYAWKHKPGGDICVLNRWKTAAKPQPILQGTLGPGYVWGLDLSWDADRVVFGYARQSNWPPAVDTADSATEGRNVFDLRQQHEPLHLFEVRLDDRQTRQLTDDPYWNDFEPTYCADGQVVFSSDRCGRSAECGNVTYDHTNPNLYIVAAEGGEVRHLTDNKDIDRYPHTLDDGRIAYTHWEYQERHFMEVHAVWTVRPDGAMSDALFKHHMTAPCGLRDTRSIPGSSKLVAIATGHHTFAYGPVVTIDPTSGLNNAAGLQIVTPGVQPQEGPMAGSPVPEGGVVDRGGLYQSPWALSEDCFLAAYAYARPQCTAPAGADSNGFALYLIDSYGNRELIHRDLIHSCVYPIPLRQRVRPQQIARLNELERSRGDACGETTIDPDEPRYGPGSNGERSAQATCFVSDVYDGMQGVPRGTIKSLRVSQHVGWPFDAERGAMDYIPGVAGSKQLGFPSWSPVRVIGDVPVAPDGSACFQVPADTAVYFQALDARHMEIVRMRSMVSFAAGEVRGCRGCHESQGRAPVVAAHLSQSLTRTPHVPTPPPWGSDRLLGYEWLVQPILDQHCVRCHDGPSSEGGLDLTNTRAADGLLQSYRTMFGVLTADGSTTGRPLVSCSDRFSDARVTRPMQFGSHKSPLVTVLVNDALHRREVALDAVAWYSLVTWVDANAPYYDAFINKRRLDGGTPKREFVPDLTTLELLLNPG